MNWNKISQIGFAIRAALWFRSRSMCAVFVFGFFFRRSASRQHMEIDDWTPFNWPEETSTWRVVSRGQRNYTNDKFMWMTHYFCNDLYLSIFFWRCFFATHQIVIVIAVVVVVVVIVKFTAFIPFHVDLFSDNGTRFKLTTSLHTIRFCPLFLCPWFFFVPLYFCLSPSASLEWHFILNFVARQQKQQQQHFNADNSGG